MHSWAFKQPFYELHFGGAEQPQLLSTRSSQKSCTDFFGGQRIWAHSQEKAVIVCHFLGHIIWDIMWLDSQD